MNINLEKVHELESVYVTEGFMQDKFAVKAIDLNEEKNSFVAKIDITDFAIPSDGIFHLSIITNTRIVGQLSIIYVFYTLNVKKDREVFQVNERWEYKKPIVKNKDLQYKFYNIKVTDKKDKVFYECDIDIENQSFIGHVTFYHKKQANNL